MERVSKKDYYLDIAAAVAKRSTCLRRQYGAVIVKNDEIVATGYNGAPRGEDNCCDVGVCWREAHGIPHGEQYEKCVQNAMPLSLPAATRCWAPPCIFLALRTERNWLRLSPA